MKLQPIVRVVAMSALCAGLLCNAHKATAQVIDFGQINSFETLGTGTQRGGSPPKTIVDDGEWHTVHLYKFVIPTPKPRSTGARRMVRRR